ALKLDHLLTDPGQLDALLSATGGNPKALDLALGYLKFSGQTLEQVTYALETARGEIFEDLFSRNWQTLDEATRRVLLVMPLFYGSVAQAALVSAAGIPDTSFSEIITHLHELALVETQQTDLHTLPRYTLHPLVRAFVANKLRQQPDFAQAARSRQLNW